MKSILIHCFLTCSLILCNTDAFSARHNRPINNRGRKSTEELQHPLRVFAIPTLIVSLFLQSGLPAAAVINEGGCFINDSVEIISLYKLSDSTAFKLLPRETQKSTSVKKLQDLKDLQDSRLAKCADRGVYWEQCFMFGESDSVNSIEKVVTGKGQGQSGIDHQLISPIGALHHSSEIKTIPTW